MYTVFFLAAAHTRELQLLSHNRSPSLSSLWSFHPRAIHKEREGCFSLSDSDRPTDWLIRIRSSDGLWLTRRPFASSALVHYTANALFTAASSVGPSIELGSVPKTDIRQRTRFLSQMAARIFLLPLSLFSSLVSFYDEERNSFCLSTPEWKWTSGSMNR